MPDTTLTSAELDEIERAFDDAAPNEEIGAFLGNGAWASAGGGARRGGEAALRKENGVAAEAGDTRWGLDTEAASLAQYHKSVTASLLAGAIRALPLTGDKP